MDRASRRRGNAPRGVVGGETARFVDLPADIIQAPLALARPCFARFAPARLRRRRRLPRQPGPGASARLRPWSRPGFGAARRAGRGSPGARAGSCRVLRNRETATREWGSRWGSSAGSAPGGPPAALARELVQLGLEGALGQFVEAH